MVEKLRDWANTTRGFIALVVTIAGMGATLITIGMFVGQLRTEVTHLQKAVERLEQNR